MKNKKAFTLIELLVVISVLGVLFAILLPNLLGMRLRARDAQKKNDLKQMKVALRLYYNDFQIYPDDNGSGGINGCGADGEQLCPDDDGGFSAGDNIYMKEIFAENDFDYVQLDGGDNFLLSIALENSSDADIVDSANHCNVSAPDSTSFYICAD